MIIAALIVGPLLGAGVVALGGWLVMRRAEKDAVKIGIDAINDVEKP